MAKLKIDGIGTVQIDDAFKDLSPEEQQQTVDAIIASVRSGQRSGRTEGTDSGSDRPQASQRHQGTDSTLEATLMDAFPQARVTGRGRTAQRNAQVNGVPDSYHLDHDALDVSLPGVSVAQVRKAFADRGIPLTEALIHDAGSGKHLHIAWDGNGGDPSLQPSAPQVDDTPITPLPDAPKSAIPSRGPAPINPLPPLAPGSYLPKPQAPTPQGSPGFVTRQANSFNDGLADTLGLPVDAVAGVLGKLGVPVGSEPFGGSASIKHGLRALGMEYDDPSFAPRSGLERYTQAAARGVGQSVVPAAGVETMAGRTAARTAPEILKALGIEARAGAGAGLGSQAANDVAPGNPIADLAGSLVGGGVGAGAVGDLRKMAQEAQVRRFVRDQASGNPHVATDAAVAGDLKTILSNLPTKAGGKPLAKALTDRTALSRIDALDSSYMPDINGYDLLPSQRSTLRTAMANRQVLTPQEIDGLRSIPQAGDVVADAITKSQRLRNAVPEVLGNGSRVNPVLGMIGDSAATATGAALGGPKGAMLGRFASAGVGNMLRSDPARAAVKLAEARAALADAYGQAASKAVDSAGGNNVDIDALTNLATAKATIRKGRDVAPSDDTQPVPDDRLPDTGAAPSPTVADRNATLEDSLNAANATEGAKTGRLVVDIVGGADPAPTDVRDTAFLKAQADKLAKAAEARKAAQLAADNRRVGIANDRDNIVPGGGWRGHVYERTGLKPADQDAGAMMLLQDGTISPSQFQAHLSNPADLMAGNAGNAIVDRLGAMADQGTLSRDPNWTPTQAAPAPTDGTAFIANPEAYRATAAGNQARVTQAMQTATDHPAFDPNAKASIKSALATLGNTSDRSAADALVSDTVDSLPDDVKADALSILQPVASAIRKRR